MRREMSLLDEVRSLECPGEAVMEVCKQLREILDSVDGALIQTTLQSPPAEINTADLRLSLN